MHTVKHAIIMAAGKGDRLAPVTLDTPKPLVKVNGVRMIDTIIDSLYANGINDIHIVTGYMMEKGEQHIDMSPIFRNGGNVQDVIEHSLRNGISPERFLDMRLYRGDVPNKRINFKMDWEHCVMHLDEPEKEEEDTDIVIYGDKAYINDTIMTLKHFDTTRIEVIAFGASIGVLICL